MINPSHQAYTFDSVDMPLGSPVALESTRRQFFLPSNTIKNKQNLCHVYWMRQEGECKHLAAFHCSIIIFAEYHWLETKPPGEKGCFAVHLTSLKISALSDDF